MTVWISYWLYLALSVCWWDWRGVFCRSCRDRRWRIWLCGCCILRAMRNLRLRSWSCGDYWSCWHRRWTMLRPCWGLSIAEGRDGGIGDVPWEPWPVYSCFVGAFVGELLGGKASGDALKAGFGAFAGFLLSVVLKVALCGYFIYSFVRGIIN